MGLPFEWVILTNPYTSVSRKTVTAQLFFRGKPFPYSTVNVFVRRSKQVDQLKLKTDKEGKVEVPVTGDGIFLINAVHMIKPDESANPAEAAWMSLWASTTFEIS